MDLYSLPCQSNPIYINEAPPMLMSILGDWHGQVDYQDKKTAKILTLNLCLQNVVKVSEILVCSVDERLFENSKNLSVQLVNASFQISKHKHTHTNILIWVTPCYNNVSYQMIPCIEDRRRKYRNSIWNGLHILLCVIVIPHISDIFHIRLAPTLDEILLL